MFTQAAPPARLVALIGGVTPSDYPLEIDCCIIGRSSSCHLVVRHALVSRYHARIDQDHNGYVLMDAGSVNGTFVNGERLIMPYRLLDRDIIGLGNKTGTFQFCYLQPIK